ncbi:MAG TPA: hypothetical protein VJB68_10040 [Methylophilaceae bacterium]|nr:hypothetical protein [Methylophilaceae bacterium]
MVQQINLLNPALIRQKEYLSAPMIMMAPGVLALVMLGIYAYGQYQLRPLVQESERTTQELQAIQARLDQVTNEYAQRNTARVLQDEIIVTEKKLQTYENILRTLGVAPTGAGQGFSIYMRAFARQHLEGLWLTGFEINDADKVMVIRGRGLQPELVPQYIIKLGLDPAFKGRTFAALDMSAQKVDANLKPDVIASQPSTAQAAAIPVALQPPLYVEFTLQSSSNKDKTAPAATGAKS